MNEEVIRIEDIVYALKKRWIMILSITMVFTLIAKIMSFFVIKPKYEAKVKVFIGKEENKKGYSTYDNNDIPMYKKLIKTYAEIVKTKDSIALVAKKINQDDAQGNISRIQSGLVVSPSADSQILSTKVDGVIFVVRAGKAKKDSIIQAKAQLDKVNAQIIGTVLNDIDMKHSKNQYYYYYDGDDTRAGKKRKKEDIKI